MKLERERGRERGRGRERERRRERIFHTAVRGLSVHEVQ